MNQGKTRPPIEGDLTSVRSYLTWLDAFTPDEVGTVGRDRLLSAPASRVEELDDGSVLVCSDHPLQREGVGRLADVAGHLEIPHWLEYLHS